MKGSGHTRTRRGRRSAAACSSVHSAVSRHDGAARVRAAVLGGEYSVRGYDLRSIGATVRNSPVVLGGNKSLLFNGEYIITVAGPVRWCFLRRRAGARFRSEVREKEAYAPGVSGPAAAESIRSRCWRSAGLEDPNAPGLHTEVTGRTSAFKTSTGAESRFFSGAQRPVPPDFCREPARGGGVLNNTLAAGEEVHVQVRGRFDLLGALMFSIRPGFTGGCCLFHSCGRGRAARKTPFLPTDRQRSQLY